MLARVSATLATLALIVSSGALAGGGWKPGRIDRHKGTVSATLTYQTRSSPDFTVPVPEYRAITLMVRQAGRIVIDHRYRGHPPVGDLDLTLRNVWGNSEPEALVETWTGGNRCCTRLLVGLIAERNDGRVLLHDFPTYTGARGQWHDGRFDFLSADNRFDCAFTDCASLSQPPQIFSIDRSGRGFVNATRSRPDLIESDAAIEWKDYLHERGTYYGALGSLAPWCADQYLLGRGSRCDQALDDALARDYLHKPGHLTGQGFINLLHKNLTEWGYRRS